MTILLPMCLLILSGRAGASEGIGDELRPLQGTWTLRHYIVNGAKKRGVEAQTTFSFNGAEWKSTWRKDNGDMQIEAGTAKIITGDAPRVMDLVHTHGPYAGTTTRVFYKVDKDSISLVSVLFPGMDTATELTMVDATYERQGIDGAFMFNGVDEYTAIPDCDAFHLNSFTLAAWVRSGDVSLTQPIVAKAAAKGNWVSYMLRIQDGGKVSLVLGNAAENREIHWRTKSSLTSGKWHHVAAVWTCERGDASDAVIYIDGVAQEIEVNREVNYARDFRPGYTDGALFIGRDEFPSGFFKGDVRGLHLGAPLAGESIVDLMNQQNKQRPSCKGAELRRQH